MKKKYVAKRLMAAGLSCAMGVGMLWGGIRDYAWTTTQAAVQNIGIDINGNQNRGNLKSTIFEDWTIGQPCQSVSYTSGDVTFTLSNESGRGNIIGGQQKTLVNSSQSPLLTCDGVSFNEITTGGALKLEIEGLSEGTHTITTWHSLYNLEPDTPRSTMTITVNGKVAASNLVIPSRVSEDKDAAIVYTSFEAKKGEKVTLLFRADGNDTEYDLPTLNAFEIDGVLQEKAISNPVPAEQDLHFEVEKGLSWQAAKDAKAHEVYLGTDETAVAEADTQSKEYLGRTTTCSYSLENQDLSYMNRYYWRVDEVFEDGTVVKGKVMWFEIAHLAFPSAEGYGRYAKGGRGGRVIEVTNLNDSGPGSLRQAVEEEKGARIIVFKVGGVIELQSRLKVPADGGNVYIAGQTAPGDGITLTKQAFGIYYAKDVIIRDIRVRVGDSNGVSTDGMGMAGADHCIIDHCSISWTTDEGTSSRGAQNITFQHNLIAEALNNSIHYDGDDRTDTERHSFAGSISGNVGSFHHNLLVNCTGRNWSMAGGMESDAKTYAGQLDIRNNVIYNYRDRTTDGGARRVNFVGNYYKKGAVSKDMKIFTIDGNELGTDDMQMAYVSGNMLVDKNGKTILAAEDDAWAKGRVAANSRFGYKESDVRSDVPFFESYVNTQPADEAYASVVSDVGAMVPKQDYLDARYVKETKSGTYTYKGSKDGWKGIIDSQEDVGGYPEFEACTASEPDSDHDGMPDAWEKEHGLNAHNAEDRNGLQLSPDGYTNLEMYLNELAGDEVVFNPYEPSDDTQESAAPSAQPQESEPAVTSEAPSAQPQESEPAVTSEAPSAQPQESEPAVTSEAPSAQPQQSEPAVTSEAPSAQPRESEPAATSEMPSSEPGVSEQPNRLLGDMDGSGEIELGDAQTVLKAALRLQKLTPEQEVLADVDENGSVELKDAQLILKRALRIIRSYQETTDKTYMKIQKIRILYEEILDKCR